ncbi:MULTISPECIES: dicarboxylate/amino acid:cation symporter [Lysinibacillus]|uniref:dicarboxylate/amino acid:cation symporter n=1 Tax=Lysinibacillus TaxID=400634 RepID=UPI00083C92C8|nr:MULTISPECIES: dicarboxylate/amino acid:cation symporter [Lysinibacillus]
MKWWRNQKLYVKIFIGVLVGIVLGFVFGPKVAIIKPIGDIFIRLLQMLIVPLAFFSIVSGITKLEDIKMLKSIGGKIMIIYVLTTLLATIIGVVTALLISPGKGEVGLLGKTEAIDQEEFSFLDNIVQWFPSNVVQSMAETNMLQIIIFAVFVGVAIVLLGDKVNRIKELAHEGADLMIKIAEIVINFAPFGIMALIANVVGTLGFGVVIEVGRYVLSAFIGFLIILLVVYPIMLKVLGKTSPVFFYKQISPAMLVACSTTSSSATLPASMEVSKRGLKIPEHIYGFTLPLGATLNMNGLASTLGVLAVFAANLYGLPITFSMILQTAFLGVVLAMGCAGVKGADVVTASLLLSTMGLPLTIIPIIAAVSPIVDMGNTVVNITGDIAGTQIVHQRNPEYSNEGV